MKPRNEGFYWIKYNQKWTIARFVFLYQLCLWYLSESDETPEDHELDEINEKQLTHE